MKENLIEVKVGAFVLAGLISIGVLVVAFSGFKGFVEPTYMIYAKFDNASGILKNSQVHLRGAKIGEIPEKPQIADEGSSVLLILRIKSEVQIPKNSTFKVGSYGLLGDRYVDVIPGDSTEFLEPGDEVKGKKSLEINEMAGELAKKIDPVMLKIDETMDRINNNLLTEQLTDDVHGVVANAKTSMEKLNGILEEAEEGKGVLHTVLKDKKVADDVKVMVREFKALSQNLRRGGVLFYKDRSELDEKKK